MLKTDPGRASGLAADGWRKLKAPGNTAILILLSIPIMLLNFIIIAGIVMLAVPGSPGQMTTFFSSITTGSYSVEIKLTDLPLGIFGLVAIMLLHELLHLAFIPEFLRSDKTYLGFMYAGVYVVTEEVLTWRRFTVISLTPYIILSVLLPIVIGAAGMLSSGLIIMAMLNGIGSSVDILGLILLISQASPGSKIVCLGMDTYWKA